MSGHCSGWPQPSGPSGRLDLSSACRGTNDPLSSCGLRIVRSCCMYSETPLHNCQHTSGKLTPPQSLCPLKLMATVWHVPQEIPSVILPMSEMTWKNDPLGISCYHHFIKETLQSLLWPYGHPGHVSCNHTKRTFVIKERQLDLLHDHGKQWGGGCDCDGDGALLGTSDRALR